jgi:hypothetical protein
MCYSFVMHFDVEKMKDWEFGAAGIANPKDSTLKRYFELIEITRNVEGAIAEFGVSTGKSLITTALLSKNLNHDRKIFGFDTFTGFPSYSPNDNFDLFDELYKEGKITLGHFEKIKLNQKYILARGASTRPDSISNSKDFANTSLALVQKKIDLFNLEKNITLIQGDFTKNLEAKIQNMKFSLILLDSDLYGSYAETLPILWKQLSPGGYIYLDEYYSLKFPGPRIAVNDFVEKSNCKLIQLQEWRDFERWAITN